MTEAAALIRSTVDRILRLKEEIDALNDDIKEVYAEAKAHGLDKAALGALVNEIRKANRLGADRIEEASSILELYREAYDSDLYGTVYAARAHTPAHAPARETNSHPAVALPDDAGNAAVVPPEAVACEAGAPDPLASPPISDDVASAITRESANAGMPVVGAPIQEFNRADQPIDSTDDCPQALSVGSPSVAGSAATASVDLVLTAKSMGASSQLNLAGPSGPAPLGEFDPVDDMPAFLRRSAPSSAALTA